MRGKFITDPFNMYPTWVYQYRHPDPWIDAATKITPWDFEDLGDPEGEENPWLEDDSWMEEEPDWREGGNWPDPSDW